MQTSDFILMFLPQKDEKDTGESLPIFIHETRSLNMLCQLNQIAIFKKMFLYNILDLLFAIIQE